MALHKLLTFLESLSREANLAIGFSLIALVGVINYVLGYELAFSLFYVFPIAQITWTAGRKAGLLTALCSAAVWLSADLAAGHTYSQAWIPLWNTSIRLSYFLLIATLLFNLKKTLQNEQRLSRTDTLTGAMNSRHFYDVLQTEIDRFVRHRRPFTLVYIDLDNFKQVNDQQGHQSGDRALCNVVEYSTRHLRKMDAVARLGGDEFALLLPETDQQAAQVALEKLRTGLLQEMKGNGWPITFSMGAITCDSGSPDSESLIRQADHLMYEVKHQHKNALKLANYQT